VRARGRIGATTALAILAVALCRVANAREISLPGAEIVAMAFSPGGDSLAVVFDDAKQTGGLAVFPLDSRKAATRWEGVPPAGGAVVHLGEVRWSPDGRELASRSGRELLFANLQTGRSCHVSLATDPTLPDNGGASNCGYQLQAGQRRPKPPGVLL
jgi:hypothetical protein